MNNDVGTRPELGSVLAEAYRLRVFAFEPLGRVCRLVTDRGPRLAVFLERPPEALELVGDVYDFLAERGWGRIPELIPTDTGERFLPLGPRQHLLLTYSLTGRPVHARQRSFPVEVAGLLADYHRVAGDFAPEPGAPGHDYAGWCAEVRDRLADLEAYELIARHRLHQGLFDRLLLSVAPRIRDSAGEAVGQVEDACSRRPGPVRTVSAGDFGPPELVRLMCGVPPAARLGFLALPGIVAGPPAADLARLGWQLAGASGWNPNPAWTSISAYAKERPLDAAAAAFIPAYLAFPFEVWQTADRYYRRKQSLSEREAVSLLEAARDAQDAREACAAELARRLKAGD